MGAPIGNKFAEGNEGGRPRIFDSPEELQEKVDAYFNGGYNTRLVVTISGSVEVPILTMSGLAYFIGFSSRSSLYEYEDVKEFSDIIKRARLRIERMYEENLQLNQPTGSIFALKNMGWKDQQNIDHTTAGQPFSRKPYEDVEPDSKTD
jgi:hypothetical protein